MKVKAVIRQRATNGLKSNSKKNDWDKALLTRDSGLDLDFLFDNKTIVKQRSEWPSRGKTNLPG